MLLCCLNWLCGPGSHIDFVFVTSQVGFKGISDYITYTWVKDDQVAFIDELFQVYDFYYVFALLFFFIIVIELFRVYTIQCF